MFYVVMVFIWGGVDILNKLWNLFSVLISGLCIVISVVAYACVLVYLCCCGV